MKSKKNPWSFAYKWSGIAILLFIVVFVVGFVTMPGSSDPSMGLGNLFVIVITTFIAVFMILVSLVVSSTRAIVPEKYLKPEKTAHPKAKKINRLLILGLLIGILLLWGFVYLYTKDFNAPTEKQKINDNFSVLPEVSSDYRSQEIK